MDALEFRLKEHQGTSHCGHVLQGGREIIRLGKGETRARHGSGSRLRFEKGGYLATCAEIASKPIG